MKIATALICLFFTISACCAENKFSFNGHKLVQLTPTTENHLQLLNQLEDQLDFDVWNRIRGINHPVTVALSPEAFEKYTNVFTAAHLSFKITNQNIQNLIDEQQISMQNSTRSTGIVGKYARYSQILNYIETVSSANQDIASFYTIGKTYGQRDLRVVVLKTSTSQKKIWLDCGIHAREWVSPAACIWFIDRLIADYRSQNSVATELLNTYEFHILPLYNPDGYEYTHTNFRLWRKNRSPNPSSSCVGTDLNRNFGFQWMVAGSSSNPCADTYAGSKPDSELENQQVEKTILASKGQWDAFITLHSYSALWLLPWGYTKTRPADYNELYAVSKIGADALKNTHGQSFTIGSPASLLYEASGGSFDWTKAIAGIKYSIALELRPAASGIDSNYGFMLPEDRVPKAGEETYRGLIAFVKEVKTKLGRN